MSSLHEIESIGERILEINPDPVPRFRIIRDVLGISKDNPLYINAKYGMLKSRWVWELQAEQEPNGSWGRFLDQDSKVKKKFATTAIAVSQALAIGLDKHDDMLKKAANYMVSILEDREFVTDRPGKAEGWFLYMKHSVAYALAKIDSTAPALQYYREQWVRIAEQAFSSGEYCCSDESKAHRAVFGLDMFYRLNTGVAVRLLSSAENKIDDRLLYLYTGYLWHKGQGINDWFRYDSTPDLQSRDFPLWINELDLLFDLKYNRLFSENAVNYIWSLLDKDGLWDTRINTKATYLAKKYCIWYLSDSWRNTLNRKIDCSVRILTLLRKYYSI